MTFSELAHARHSVRHYQPGLTLDDATLKAIFDDVLLSPSSFNLQHWQFVVVRDQARKQALRPLCYGQAQVEDCAAVVLVCGRKWGADSRTRAEVVPTATTRRAEEIFSANWGPISYFSSCMG